MNEPAKEQSRILIAGGGVAGLEAMLAVSDLCGGSARVTLADPEPDFLYKPLMVEEPFALGPAERFALAPLAAEKGAEFKLTALRAVRPAEHEAELSDGSTVPYDFLIVCAGGRFVDAVQGATTFPSRRGPFDADTLLDSAKSVGDRIAFIVPGGTTWALPLYELALMTEARARERGLETSIAVITPETAPLAIFGSVPSDQVAELLRGRGIEFIGESTVREVSDDGIRLTPGDRMLEPARAIALPGIEGPSVPGLPDDERGFIPVDQHSRVKGAEDVYAAGDGTNFPIKQGGLASQQADAAAEHIAARLGARGGAEPFKPVLRGKLLTGAESVHLRADVAGGKGEGKAAADCLWWPPHKISARYLAPLLSHGEGPGELEPPRRSLDVEVALPQEWHEEPMALDPHRFPEAD